MKLKTQPKPAPRAPNARVIYQERFAMWPAPDDLVPHSACALIPCATEKQARALVRFANMTEEERLSAMDSAFVQATGLDEALVAIHDLIFKGGAK